MQAAPQLYNGLKLPGQRCYGGVRLLGSGPCPSNVARLDMGAVPYMDYCMRRGLQVDLDHFAKMEVQLVEDMERITEEVRRITGYYVNIDSGDQVADLLFNKMGLKQARRKMTTSGDRESVADDVLTAIQHDHPVIPKLQDFKELSKLLGTYVRPMPKLARRTKFSQWRMYPNLGQTRVPSGRLNCREPNLLAMPTRTERGKDIRNGFITEEGWVYLSCDLSQIEPRGAAYLTQDEGLIKVYENEEDIYSDFATAAFNLPDERYFDEEKKKWKYPTVDANEHRRPAKTCVLASIYEVTGAGLLEQMPVICANCNKEASQHDCHKFRSLWTEDKCDALIAAFYTKYSGILMDRRNNHKRILKYGMTWDVWGRLLHVAASKSVLPLVVAQAFREAGNFPVQSFAQGVCKVGMSQIMQDLQDMHYLGDTAHPLLQIHDELLLEVRADVAEELGEHIKYRFENCCDLGRVPIKAGVATAATWGQLDK